MTHGFRTALGTAVTAALLTSLALAAPAAAAPAPSAALEAPECATTPIYEYDVIPATDTTITKRGFNGAIIDRADGSLLLIADEFSAVEDWDPGVITGAISTDGGATFGTPFVIQENIGERTIMSQGVVRLGPTTLGLAFAKIDNNAVISQWFKTSDDDGLTWNEEYQTSPGTGHYAAANDRLVMLSTGRLILPLGGDTSVRPGDSGVFTMYSDDLGVTWEVSEFATQLSDYPAEPVLVELTDGRLLMLIRGTGGDIEKSYSSDGGHTWSDTETAGVRSPYAPTMIKRIEGRLVLIWNDSPTENRRPLSIATSDDEGLTWTKVQNLTPSTSGIYAYPSLLHHDGKLYITMYTYTPYGATYTLPLRLQVWDDCLVVPEVVAPAITATAPPVISGTAKVGRTLSSSAATWDTADVTVSLQWTRNGTAIPGATASTYRLVAQDAGASIALTATASKADHTDGTAEAAAVSVAKAVSVTVAYAKKLVIRQNQTAQIAVVVAGQHGIEPTGEVRISKGGTVLTTAVLTAGDDGRITIPVDGLGRGVHLLTVTYAGDAAVAGSKTLIPAVVTVR